MDEYISREAGFEILQSRLDSISQMSYLNMDWHELDIMRNAIKDAINDIREVPAADVQPVNRWISVDKALPIYGGLVLAVDKNNTIRLGMYTDLGWTSQFGNPMVAHITHWQPLPKPPKDGDTNG